MRNIELASLAIVIERPDLGYLLLNNADDQLWIGREARIAFVAIDKAREDGHVFTWPLFYDLFKAAGISQKTIDEMVSALVSLPRDSMETILKDYLTKLKSNRAKGLALKEISKQLSGATYDLSEIRKIIDDTEINSVADEDPSIRISYDEYLDWITREKDGVLIGFPSFDRLTDALNFGELVSIMGRTRTGKCHAKGTKTLMFDGSLKNVESIIPGDVLMGPDSKPRKVLRTGVGRGDLYRVQPLRGEGFIVNGDHVLSLRKTGYRNRQGKYQGGKIVNVTVKDYLSSSRKFRHIHKLYRTPIDFKGQPTELDPYFLGIWLGDGTKVNAQITTADKEIKDFLTGYATKLGLRLTEYKRRDKENKASGLQIVGKKTAGNPILNELRRLGLSTHKHIPETYKINSRESRLSLLAGLIDTDGSKERNGYEITTINETLADDIVFLCRSLGFSANKKKRTISAGNNFKGCGFTYRIHIGGRVGEIPVRIPRKKQPRQIGKVNVTNVGFSLLKDGAGDYYGFTLNGDGLYILDSFIVNHNSWIGINTMINISRANSELPIAFFSMEMPKAAIAERMMQIEYNKSRWELKPDIRVDPDGFRKIFVGRFPNVSIYGGIYGTDEIESHIKKRGHKIIFIDFLGLVRPRDSSGSLYQQVSQKMVEIKQMAKKNNVLVFLLVQLSRAAGYGNLAVTLDMARESGSVEELSDFIYGIWDPSLNPTSDVKWKDHLVIGLLKNKRGPGKEIVCHFNKTTGRIIEEEHEDLG